MRKVNIKIGITIALFSIILTSIFIGGFYWFQATSAQALKAQTAAIDSVYILSSKEAYDVSIESSYVTIKPDNIIPTANFQNYITAPISNQLPIMIAFFCIILMISSFILWRILKTIQQKSTELIVTNLKSIPYDDITLKMEPALAGAYKHLKEMFNSNLEDYKRLNSYLSHEQKNAIAVLRTDFEISQNEEQIKSLDRISDSIDDILTISDSANISDMAEVDVSMVCAQACDDYRKKTTKINFYFDEESTYTIWAKERWIYRAICNLLDNAIKYGEDKPIEINVKNKNNSIIISVHDNGIGIPQELQDKIFNHRYRINELNKDGYGIGLSLVSHVCDLCSGFVWVESEKNKGSTFYLSFPEMNED